MNKASLDFWFNISLFIFVPVGAILYVWWARRTYRRMVEAAGKLEHKTLRAYRWLSLSHMWPGMLMFAICFLPLIYFNRQRQQYDYCLQVVRKNPGINRNDPALTLPCSCFDIDEIVSQASQRDN